MNCTKHSTVFTYKAIQNLRHDVSKQTVEIFMTTVNKIHVFFLKPLESSSFLDLKSG